MLQEPIRTVPKWFSDIIGLVKGNKEDELRVLLEAGETEQKFRNTGLMFAAMVGHTVIMELLIRHGATRKCLFYGGPIPPNPEVGAILPRAGADPNSEAVDGTTVLISASRKGLTELVTALLNYGADIDAQGDSRGENRIPIGRKVTALDVANGGPMRQLLLREIRRRAAAALSIIPNKVPKDVRVMILELMRQR